MNEYERMLNLTGQDFTDPWYWEDHDGEYFCICEQLFAEYLMQAGMLPYVFRYVVDPVKGDMLVFAYYKTSKENPYEADRTETFEQPKPRYWK